MARRSKMSFSCQYHGTEAHHANMAALLTTEIKNKLGW